MKLSCNVSLQKNIYIILQWGYSALMEAAKLGETEIVSLLVKAGAALDLQNEVVHYVILILYLFIVRKC